MLPYFISLRNSSFEVYFHKTKKQTNILILVVIDGTNVHAYRREYNSQCGQGKLKAIWDPTIIYIELIGKCLICFLYFNKGHI